MTRQEIEILSLIQETKCKLAPSPIHGIGVFAIRDIKQGEKLYLLPKPILQWYQTPYSVLKARLQPVYPEIFELLMERWPSIINGSHFLAPHDMAVLLTFMNHSDEPNYQAYGSERDTALKDIKKGEEVTEDYRGMENWELIYPWLKVK